MSDRFWRDIKPDVAESLSVEQRGEIERLLKSVSDGANEKISDLRLSCPWFFVRIACGTEQRSTERLKQEQTVNSPWSRRNFPTLAMVFGGWLIFWFAMVTLATWLLFHFLK